MAEQSIVLTPVIEGVEKENLLRLANELLKKVNEILELIDQIEDSVVKVELRLTQRQE